MPEESIATYNNNIITFVIIIAVILFIFLVLFMVSRFLVYKDKYRYFKTIGGNRVGINKNDENTILKDSGVESRNYKKDYNSKDSYFVEFKKDPYLQKNVLTFSLVFVFNIFFIFVTTLALDFTQHYKLGGDLFLILLLLFFLIVSCVYLVKSKIFS